MPVENLSMEAPFAGSQGEHGKLGAKVPEVIRLDPIQQERGLRRFGI